MTGKTQAIYYFDMMCMYMLPAVSACVPIENKIENPAITCYTDALLMVVHL